MTVSTMADVLDSARHLSEIIEGTETPSPRAWFALCEALDTWEAPSDEALEGIVLPQLNAQLASWPDVMRPTHRPWIDLLIEGEHVTCMMICRALDLRGMHLFLDDAELLAESPELHHIRRLNLAYNGLQDEGTRALVESPFVANLRALDLSGNSVGVEGITALCHSAHLSGLRHLDLTGNWVNDEAATLIANNPHFANLETLILRGNPVRDKGAHALATSEHLCDSIRARWSDQPAP